MYELKNLINKNDDDDITINKDEFKLSTTSVVNKQLVNVALFRTLLKI